MSTLVPVALAADSSILDLIGQLVAATGGGDQFFMAGNELLIVNNGGGVGVTVTVTASGTLSEWTPLNLTATIAAGKIGLINVNYGLRFRDANGNVQLTYSGVTSVTVGVFRIGRGAS